MGRVVRLLVTALVVVVAQCGGALAMQFTRVPLDGGGVVILARGPIILGDFARLGEFSDTMPATDHIVGFAIDSPGGNVQEAEKLAGLVRTLKLSVGVLKGSQCASACFLIFAAASIKVAAPDALIGVHSVSIDGQESPEALALTTVLARNAAELGVPPAIVGKLVETAPGRMEWLTPEDLASMGVRIAQTAPMKPPTADATPGPAAPTASEAAPTSASQEPIALQQGLADRRSWEAWFAGLSGAHLNGASWWAADRSLPKPASCYSTTEGQSSADWAAGCLAAQQRLAPSDVRRKAEPEYRRGWNSH